MVSLHLPSKASLGLFLVRKACSSIIAQQEAGRLSLDERSTFIGGYSLSAPCCPVGSSQCSWPFGTTCCPTSSVCSTFGDYCCPSDQDCSDTVDTAPSCGDPSWELHKFPFPDGGICCVPGWDAVQSLGSGVCTPPANDTSPDICAKATAGPKPVFPGAITVQTMTDSSGAITTTTSYSNSGNGNRPLSAGAVAGTTLGSVVAVLILAGLGFFFYRRKKQRERERREREEPINIHNDNQNHNNQLAERREREEPINIHNDNDNHNNQLAEHTRSNSPKTSKRASGTRTNMEPPMISPQPTGPPPGYNASVGNHGIQTFNGANPNLGGNQVHTGTTFHN